MGDEVYKIRCVHGREVFDPETGESVCNVCGSVLGIAKEQGYSGGLPSRLGSVIREKEIGQLGIKPQFVARKSKEDAWFDETELLCERANMPGYVRDSVYQFYAKHRDGMGRARRTEAITALIYAYGKETTSKTFEQLCDETRADLFLSRRYLFDYASKLDLRIPYKSPEDYVAHYSSKLNAPKYVREYADEILEKYENGSANPRTLAASALYISYKEYGEKITQKGLAEIVGVAEYTVRETCGYMRKELGGEYG